MGERVVTVGDDLEIETGDGADNVRISNTTVEDGKIDVDLGGDDDTLTIEGITARKARFNGGRGDRDTLLDDGNDIDKSKNKNFEIFLP